MQQNLPTLAVSRGRQSPMACFQADVFQHIRFCWLQRLHGVHMVLRMAAADLSLVSFNDLPWTLENRVLGYRLY